MFVIPPWVDIPEGEYEKLTEQHDFADVAWFCSLKDSESTYNLLLESGWQPQQARSVLPNSLKTEIVVTANAREWRHIFNLRCSATAHPQMQEVMIPLRKEFTNRAPVLFGNIQEDNGGQRI